MKTYEEAVKAFASKITAEREWARKEKCGTRAERAYKNRLYTADVCSFMLVVYGQGAEPGLSTDKIFDDIIAICGYPDGIE